MVSTNPLDTTLGVQGREEGKGTVKITHSKPAGADGNAAALSIALLGEGTACQGIFIGNDSGNPTTGKLLNVRNGGPDSERLSLTADGRLALPVQGPVGGIVLGSDANLYRKAPGTLATDGGIQARVVELPPQPAPAPPASGVQARLYVKGSKLVVEWREGDAVLYTAIPLDTAGPYPVTPQVTTDTTPP